MEIKTLDLRDVLEQLGEDLDPYQRFIKFYELLGWDKETVLDPTQIKLNKDDWMELVTNEMRHASKFNIEAVNIGFLWVDRGPSTDEKVPRGTVIIEKGRDGGT